MKKKINKIKINKIKGKKYIDNAFISPTSPDEIVCPVDVVIQEGGGEAKEFKLLPPGLVVIEGIELHC